MKRKIHSLIFDDAVRKSCAHSLKSAKIQSQEISQEDLANPSDIIEVLFIGLTSWTEESIQTISRIKQANPSLPIICLVAHPLEGVPCDSVMELIEAVAPLPADPVLLNDTLSLAFQTRQLEIETRETSQKLHAVEEEFRMFQKVGRTIASSLDLNQVLTDIMNVTGQLLKSEAWSLALKDMDTSELVFEAARGDHSDQIRGLRIPQGKGVIGWVAEEGEPLIVADTQKDQRHFKDVDITVGFETRSILCLPLRTKGRILGAIEFINKLGVDQFSPDDINRIKVFVDLAAVSIENALLYRKVTILSERDELTGLYNQRALVRILDREMYLAAKTGQSVAYLFLDLDHFKKVNDQYGHLVGRMTLTEVGMLLPTLSGDREILGRYGGDEFWIISPGTDEKKTMELAEKIRGGIEDHTFLQDLKMDVKLTASVGVALYPDQALTFDDLARMADKALFQAKQSDRNQVIYLRPENVE
jgi:diguanylate cyclase (GGDEF)-like protein